MPPRDRLIALVLLSAYAVVATLGIGWTVCRGADGHVAVEALAAACCAGSEAPSSSDAPADDACGDCDDTSLSEALTVQAVEAPPDLPIPPDVAASSVALGRSGCSASAQFAPASIDARDRPPDPLLDRLRTVVLRS